MHVLILEEVIADITINELDRGRLMGTADQCIDLVKFYFRNTYRIITNIL